MADGTIEGIALETPPFFPHLNAALNATALVLLVTGYLLIKRGRERGHKIAMLSCFAVSVMFLASYLWYHGNYPRRFLPGDAAPLVYYTYQFILWTHIALAAVVPVLAISSRSRGRRPQSAGESAWR